MKESINRKPAVVSTVKYPEMGLPMGLRCVALFAVLVFANLLATVFAQSSLAVAVPNKVLPPTQRRTAEFGLFNS